MATLRPFAALRPTRERAAAVSSVPYDVVTVPEARALAAGNPWSFLHVSRAEIDLPDATDPYADLVYEKAKTNFERLRCEAPFVQEEAPSTYLYRLRRNDHAQTGVAATWSLDEYQSGGILRHETTRRDKENDRTRHMVALRAQTGTVFLTYRPRQEVDEIVERETAAEPLYDFTSTDGITHTLWRVSAANSARLVKEFQDIPALYIADGHHRVASAARAREELRRADARSRGEANHDFFIAVAFPSDQVRILPYNRVVKDLGGRTPEQFLEAVRSVLPVTEGASPAPRNPGDVSMCLAGRWYGLRLDGQAGSPGRTGSADRAAALDVARLQARLLEPILGIGDVRTDKRIDFVGGIRGTDALDRLVATGGAAVAFSMHPVSLEDLMAVSDAGGIMPPKSTWFEPKLRDGLLIHTIGEGL